MLCLKTLSAAICACAIMFVSPPALAAPQQRLLRHVPQAIRESHRVRPLPRKQRIDLAIGLPLRHREELDRLLEQVSDPRSTNYRRYLSADEFAERFGPTQEDYDKLSTFMAANGFAISGTHANRMILDVSGAVSAVENTFHVNMSTWEHPIRGQFFALDSDPWLDVDVAVLDITGLDNFVLPRPMDVKAIPFASAAPFVTGSGPSGLFIGKDFRAAYAPGVTRSGAGQTIGLFELDGYYASDVQANFQRAGLPPVPVQTVLLNAFNGSPGGANIEVILDIMMAAYIAPGANILVYEGYNWNDILNRMATDNIARQLSSSWCFSPINATTEQIFMQMVAQGQSFLQASGDSGAYHGWIMPPSDNPNVTVVGGTALTTTGPGGTWMSESAWSGSGGGTSTTYSIPSYQQNMNLAALGGSNTMRNIPDVALTAAVQLFLIADNGRGYSIGGTSAAAPLWAGFIALANEQAAANGKPPAGFLNPALYALGGNSNYSAALHDISTGSNGFAAIPGFDLATGWGTPAGQSLINYLTSIAATPSFALSATPSAVTLQTGSSTTVAVQITHQTGFSGTVNLSASGLPSGVTGTFTALSSSGAATLTLAATTTAPPNTVTVLVNGKSGSLGATAALTLTLTSPPTFSMAASPATLTILQGASAASTITIKPASGFSGKVNLTASGLPDGVTASFNPATTAGTSVVTLSATSSATPGTASIALTGTAGGWSNSVTLALTVKAAPGFSLSALPATLTIPQGGSGTSTFTLAPLNGFTGSATLAVAGLPTGVTAAFSPASITSASSLKLTVTTSAPLGTNTATITATSGGVSATTKLALTVAAPPGFKLSSSASNVSISPGTTGAVSVAVSPQGGFSGPVALTAAGLPAGVTAAFSPATATTSSTLMLTAGTSAVARTSQFTVNGTSGNLTDSFVMSVIVTPPPGFGLAIVPASLSVMQGAKGAAAVAITALNGFAGPIALSAAGLPAGVTVSFSTVGAGGPYLANFTVPSAIPAGTSAVTVTATSGTLSRSGILNLTVVATPTGTALVDLSPFYNVAASAVDSFPFTNGGLDALGRSYSGVALGASQSVAGTVFSLGPMGVPGAVSGQKVALPTSQFTTLKLLATGVNGNQPAQPFTVTYTDGTTSSFAQSLSDWYTPQNYAGESKAVSTTYRDNSTGTTDGRTFYVYGYSFNLNAGKAVQSISLPQNRNVVVLAITLVGTGNLVAAVQVDLSKTFTGIGITSDGKPFTAGMDGLGNAYSGSLLPAIITFNNTQFQFAGADRPNVVSGTSAAIALPAGKYSTALLLAAGVNGAQLAQPFKVTYTDGSSVTFTQSLSDWFYPANYSGEITAFVMPYRNAANGTRDNRKFELYQYTFALNNTKTVSTITLPANNNVKVFAVTLTP